MLGGGVGGMTAAFELTATPELRDRFDVTVYQLGWRLGGKGASGRNAAPTDRIEEHGLHVWFGFYDNAFRLMRDAYEELGRAPGTPLATFDDAFKPCDQLVLYDRQDGGWHGHALRLPAQPAAPGRPGRAADVLGDRRHGVRLGAGRLARRCATTATTSPPPTDDDVPFLPDWFENLAADLAADLLDLPIDRRERLLGLAERLARRRAGSTDHPRPLQAAQPALLVQLLKSFRDWLWTAVPRRRCDDEPDLRFFFTAVDAGVSTLAGIVEDGVLEHGFDVINDEDWAAWLRRHGAKEMTLGTHARVRSPALRSVYDVAFGYPGGEIAAADCAAGTATSDLLRLAFSYRGSIMYKMQAGMGDAVFTPALRGAPRAAASASSSSTRSPACGSPRTAARVDEIEVVAPGRARPRPSRVPPARGREGAPLLAERAALGPAATAPGGRRAAGLRARARTRSARPAHTLERGPRLRRGRPGHPGRRAGPTCAAS